jgi:hypothetical protein
LFPDTCNCDILDLIKTSAIITLYNPKANCG